jgi:hypothetical protein
MRVTPWKWLRLRYGGPLVPRFSAGTDLTITDADIVELTGRSLCETLARRLFTRRR